jgi:hypothetical protein
MLGSCGDGILPRGLRLLVVVGVRDEGSREGMVETDIMLCMFAEEITSHLTLIIEAYEVISDVM